MSQRGDVGQPVVELLHAREAQEEFEIRLSIRDGNRVEGSVLHRRSGRRESVTAWNELEDILTRFLETADEDGAGDP